MGKVFRAIRYSVIGIFIAGIISVIQGCSLKTGALLVMALLGLQLCNANQVNTLYWIQFSDDEKSIFKCDLEGPLPCTPIEVIKDTSTGQDLSAIEVGPGGGYLYWAIEGRITQDGVIRRCSLRASQCQPETVGSIGNNTADQLKIDAEQNFIYWSNGGGFISGCSLASLPCTQVQVSNQANPGFWFGIEKSGNVLFATQSDFLRRCPLSDPSNCTFSVLTTGTNLRALKVDPGRALLYLARTNNIGVGRCSLAAPTCKLEQVAGSTAGFPSALGVDMVRNELYWRAKDRTLDRCSLDGSLPCTSEQVILKGVRVRQLDLGP